MAREGQEEQTFLGSTKKKSWSSGQNEMVFRRLRPVFVASKASGSAVVSAGLALVSRDYPWFFHSNTVRYDSEGTRYRLRVDRSISATSTFNSVLLGSPAGSNLSGFASQFANRFRCTAKQLRIA